MLSTVPNTQPPLNSYNLLRLCCRLNNGSPKMSMSYSPAPVNTVSHTMKGILQTWLRISWWGDYPGYLGWPNVITNVLTQVRQVDQFVVADVTMEAKGWSEARKEPKAKEGRQLLKAKHGPKTDSAWKLLEGTEPWWHFDFRLWSPDYKRINL